MANTATVLPVIPVHLQRAMCLLMRVLCVIRREIRDVSIS